MKYLWEILAVVYLGAILAIYLGGFHQIQSGKIGIAVLGAGFVSAFIKIIEKWMGKNI